MTGHRAACHVCRSVLGLDVTAIGDAELAVCRQPSCWTSADRDRNVLAVFGGRRGWKAQRQVREAADLPSPSATGRVLERLVRRGWVETEDFVAERARVPRRFRLTRDGVAARPVTIRVTASRRNAAQAGDTGGCGDTGADGATAGGIAGGIAVGTAGSQRVDGGRDRPVGAAGTAIGYLSAARLSRIEAGAVRRGIGERAAARGLVLTAVYVETWFGARAEFDRLRRAAASAAVPDAGRAARAVVLLPSLDHLPGRVWERDRALDDLEQSGVVVEVDDDDLDGRAALAARADPSARTCPVPDPRPLRGYS